MIIGSLDLAASMGHLNIVEALLKDNRVNLSSNNNEAIRLAATNGHFMVVKP